MTTVRTEPAELTEAEFVDIFNQLFHHAFPMNKVKVYAHWERAFGDDGTERHTIVLGGRQ